MSKKKKNNDKKVFLLISIILFLIAILINRPTVLRLIITLIGIILFVVTFNLKNKTKNIFMGIGLLLLTVIIDSFIASIFVRVPIYAYNINTSGNVRVYSSLGYRIWQCDKNDYKNLKADVFYNKGYVCDPDDIEEIDSNSFLNSVIENYDEYKNNYVKIKGKISKKNSQNSIEMKPYEQSSITVNGYVTFADNITLKIMFNEQIQELDLYDIYDEIVVIGVVKTLEHNDEEFIVYLTEARLVSSPSYDKYNLVINKENKCSEEKVILYSTDSEELYSYCLDEIIVDYGESKFEISHALSSAKLEIDDLFKNSLSVDKDEKENELYKFKEYNILKCNKNNSKAIIMGPTDMKIDSVSCEEEEPEGDEVLE